MDKKVNRVKYFIDNKLNPVTGWVDSKKQDDYQLITSKNNKQRKRVKLFSKNIRKVNDNIIN